MAPKAKSGPAKGGNKRPSKPSKGGTTFKAKKSSSFKPKPTQQKTKSAKESHKKKPAHLRYTEKELGVPLLNGIRPAGVQKPPNAKKGKKFVDDNESMNAILAIVMAEKEGNIESKMMRARQLEEVREARRLEAEKRVESKKAGFEDRKQGIKDAKRRGSSKQRDAAATEDASKPTTATRKPKKRVSFG